MSTTHQIPPTPRPLQDIAMEIGLQPDHLELIGRQKAKIALAALEAPPKQGKLILVSAMTPTPAGEGKTTVAIGLAQGLKASGRHVAIALREPSMGPVFGSKGGGTGGGRSFLTPMEDINLHFNGDFHAITSAHNLLAAALDNALHFGTTDLDPQRVVWKRVLDVNDRALRRVRVGLGDPSAERDSSFDITAASEIMAVICLAQSYADLRARLERMLVGYSKAGAPVTAGELRVTGAMMALLREALKPNLVQSIEGVPAFVHGGPFANIAHGCNSILATRLALGYAEYAVTEAGFGFDLGGEKFLQLKCPLAGLAPDAIVLVATVRALRLHGGVPLADVGQPSLAAVRAGLPNLAAHIEAAQSFGRPVVVALNTFPGDTAEEQAAVRDDCQSRGVACAIADVFASGGAGALELAEAVVAAAAKSSAPLPVAYGGATSPEAKIEAIARDVYGADGVDFTASARSQLASIREFGYDDLAVCMAKTPLSLTDDPKLPGRPTGFRITVRELEIASGAGFIVALTGKTLRMPALPKVPAAERIDLADDGGFRGLR